MLQCPENTTNGRITCSNCGGNKGPLCDAQERHDMVIMFNQHGGRSWKRKRKTLMTNIAKKAGVSLEEMERQGADVASGLVDEQDVDTSVSDMFAALAFGTQGPIEGEEATEEERPE